MIKFVSCLRVYRGVKLAKNNYRTLQVNQPNLHLCIVWNWVYASEMGNSFHAASSLCHTSSTILVEGRWRTSVSTIHNHMPLMGDKLGERLREGNSQIPCASGKVRIWRAMRGLALSCWKMAFGRPLGSSTTARVKNVRNVLSFKPLSIKQEIWVPRFQWLPKSSPQMQNSLCLYRILAGDVRSSRDLQNHIRPSKYCMQSGDSSEKTTLCNSIIQLFRSQHESGGIPLSCIAKGSRSNNHRTDWPRCAATNIDTP